MDPHLLPLFPLSLVVFPGMRIPLHIFEDRYKEMMADIIPGRKEFGIVLAKDEGIVNVGCTAIVEDVIRRYPDGQLDLVAVGQRRFELERLDDDRSFLQAQVDYFDDEDAASPSEDLRRRALAASRQLLEEASLPEGGGPRINSPRLSFELGQLISDVDRRQVLLSSRSEVERLELLVKMLPEYVIQRERTALARRVGPLNGHAKHVASS